MGVADAMLALGLRYGSNRSVQFVNTIYKQASLGAWAASTELAKERGPFPAFDAEKHLSTPLALQMPPDIRDAIAKTGIRNGVLETQAPTGTTASLMGVSSGIEPVFNFLYRRKDRTGERLIVHPELRKVMPSDTNWDDLADNPERLEEAFAKLPSHFIATQDISPMDHVDVQAAAQRWVGNAISKTTNMPNSATVEQVSELYRYAYDQGLKGITIYRDGSRDEQVLYHVGEDGESVKEEELPEVLNSLRFKVRFPAGNGYVHISERHPGHPVEMFIMLGKSGTGDNASAEALARMISSFWRHTNLSGKEKVDIVMKQLTGIRGDTPYGFGSHHMTTTSDGVVYALGKYLEVLDSLPERQVIELEDCFAGDCK